MKAIVIADCIDCPLGDIRKPKEDGGVMWCTSSVWSTKGYPDGREVALTREILEAKERMPPPEWCPLTDLAEVVEWYGEGEE